MRHWEKSEGRGETTFNASKIMRLKKQKKTYLGNNLRTGFLFSVFGHSSKNLWSKVHLLDTDRSEEVAIHNEKKQREKPSKPQPSTPIPS